MKHILFLLLLSPIYLFSQTSAQTPSGYAYAEYVNSGLTKCDVIIHFSADSTLDYLHLKKEKKVSYEDQIHHSFEVLQYMESQGYSATGISQNYDPSNLNMNHYSLLIFFKREKK
jgi:hypothetical protein